MTDIIVKTFIFLWFYVGFPALYIIEKRKGNI